MKKIILIMSLALAFIMTSCSQNGPYKRINIKGEMMGESKQVLETTLVGTTKVENYSDESYANRMPVYQITPREITTDEFQTMVDYFDIQGEIQIVNDTIRISEYNSSPPSQTMRCSENSLSYRMRNGGSEAEMLQTDAELETEAWKIVNTLPLLEGEYEYVGIASTQRLERESGSIVVAKRLSFRRLIDGVRVIGNDICDLYFNSKGLYDIEIKFYDYEKTGELDMLTLDDAVAKVKEPDAFILESETNRNFSGAAEKLTIERTKLLFVNQYSDGCEILQPVYNLMGTAENAGGSVEFSARIIAIPEKYTHE